MGVRVQGEQIWLDGAFVPWADAKVHVLTHTLHYGLGVFEGIRCYRTADGRSAVFRLGDHVRRLFDSARINLLEIRYSPEQIEEAILESLRRNHLLEGYIRPIVFLGDGEMGLNPGGNPVRTAVIAWAWGKYLGEESMEAGIRAKISSFCRHHVNAKMSKGKTCGDYVNSILAKREALLDGYDEALMLDTQGCVAEASGENIFLVRDGVLRTPPLYNVLDGITRATVIELARDAGLPFEERTHRARRALRRRRDLPDRHRRRGDADPRGRPPPDRRRPAGPADHPAAAELLRRGGRPGAQVRALAHFSLAHPGQLSRFGICITSCYTASS